ncbi:MAG: nicotinate (nicotinamide) nucleotide adenylyltransferase [Elusimicrobiota bacterium]|nr:nicotinate (nicotinamide) nucleotide adenylyltransferase [Elusimicrobiota bacterium]
MSYILYGGLFDPVHMGHTGLARAALQKIKAEKVIWLPSSAPPHRTVEGIPANQRKEMMEWLFKDKDEYEVSDVDLSRDHSGYTAETVSIYKEKFSGKDLYLLIGSDEAESFKQWKNWEYILENTRLLIGRREDDRMSFPREVEENSVLLDNKVIDISSTQIREKLKKGESVEGYLPDRLEEYIARRGLYK